MSDMEALSRGPASSTALVADGVTPERDIESAEGT